MFDGNERLVVCNQTWICIKVSGDVVKPGITLQNLLKYRICNGSFTGDPVEYRRDLVGPISAGKTTSTEVKSANGRSITVINRPMADGGWVATRQRVEDHLKTVGEGARTMHATATTLFSNSAQTSQSADGAVSASNEASTNVETAAVAADEPSGSINEIGRQLAKTTEIVRIAVTEAHGTTARSQRLRMLHKRLATSLNSSALSPDKPTCWPSTPQSKRHAPAKPARTEVKSLAVQTAKATEDISKLIMAVQAATTSAVSAIGRISGRMQEIDSCAIAVSAAVEEQSAATGEISQNVASAFDGAKVVVQVLGDVSGAAAQTRESAENVLSASQTVESAAAELRREVESFLARVAA